MREQRYWQRAIGVGLSVFITGMAVYTGMPTSFDQLYQPAIQGILATLTTLGLNVSTRQRP